MKITLGFILAGFAIGYYFGNQIGIAGSFGAINGGVVVGLIGAYIGWRLNNVKKRITAKREEKKSKQTQERSSR